MVEYALAGDGAGSLIDRDSYKNRRWPEDGALADIYKHCGCTVIRKCPTHDDYTKYKFLLSDPLSTQSEVFSYRQEQQANRPETMGNYILFQELLDRYPHYVLRGSSKAGDTFYRQKGARFNYVPPYRVCTNELYRHQRQWILKDSTNESQSRPSSVSPILTLQDEHSQTAKNEHRSFPTLPSRSNSTANASTARSYHRSNYFYDMAL